MMCGAQIDGLALVRVRATIDRLTALKIML
jgi:hypothetical protein